MPNGRYLLKDVDSFAGFAHAINTFVAGVALADLHRLRLIYQPLRVAHGMGHAWDDFFAGDPRGLVRPLIAPALTFSNVSGLQIDGSTVKLVQILNRGPKEDASKRVNATLSAVTSDTLVWLRKGRSTFLPCTDGCEIPAELICKCRRIPTRRTLASHPSLLASSNDRCSLLRVAGSNPASHRRGPLVARALLAGGPRPVPHGESSSRRALSSDDIQLG